MSTARASRATNALLRSHCALSTCPHHPTLLKFSSVFHQISILPLSSRKFPITLPLSTPYHIISTTKHFLSSLKNFPPFRLLQTPTSLLHRLLHSSIATISKSKHCRPNTLSPSSVCPNTTHFFIHAFASQFSMCRRVEVPNMLRAMCLHHQPSSIAPIVQLHIHFFPLVLDQNLNESLSLCITSTPDIFSVPIHYFSSNCNPLEPI